MGEEISRLSQPTADINRPTPFTGESCPGERGALESPAERVEQTGRVHGREQVEKELSAALKNYSRSHPST